MGCPGAGMMLETNQGQNHREQVRIRRNGVDGSGVQWETTESARGGRLYSNHIIAGGVAECIQAALHRHLVVLAACQTHAEVPELLHLPARPPKCQSQTIPCAKRWANHRHTGRDGFNPLLYTHGVEWLWVGSIHSYCTQLFQI